LFFKILNKKKKQVKQKLRVTGNTPSRWLWIHSNK